MPSGPVPDFRDDRLGGGVPAGMAFSARRGRPKKSVDKELLSEVLRMYFVEKLSMRKIADVVGMSHMSVYRMLSDPTVELLI
ncbi:MAG: hypothetical protein AB1295_06275 [Candidatus Micrarchaeota archaeon]